MPIRVRRRIYLVGFFALAVAPTVVVLAWGLAWRLPTHIHAEAECLGRQLGMEVSLDGVEHPRPGVIRYRGLDVSSPETGRTVLRCRVLEAQIKDLAPEQGESRPTLLLSALQPEVDTAEMAGLGELVDRAKRLGLGNSQCDVLLAADQIQLKTGANAVPLTDAQGAVRTTAAGTQAIFCFRPPGDKKGATTRIRLGRNRQTEPPEDWFEIDTGGAALSCNLLGLAITPMRSLGADARFRGHLWATRAPDGWQGEIKPSRFLGVDLDRLVTDRFAHQLSGVADVAIEYARFRSGRMEEIGGSILAGPGKVSRPLLDAAVAQLGFKPGTLPTTADAVVPYDELAFSFAANASGLRLDGHCRTQSGAVMCAAGQSILGPPRQASPVVALLRTLTPRHAEPVLVSPETEWLARRLPLGK